MTFLASLLFAASMAGGWQAAIEAAGFDPAGVTFLVGAAGARDTGRRVPVRSVEDLHDPSLEIIWQESVEIPVFDVPASARVFAKDRKTGAPLEAAWMEGGRPVLWTAVSPGTRGYERFPFLPHALLTLGVEPRLEARNLWIFFDSSYRLRVDLDYLAKRWRQGGVSAVHVAAWHYWEPDAARDAFLKRLIETCHRHAILVYAWVELPHVSEQFWLDHPDWRERTASGQDAHLDWRKLMDLTEPQCDSAVREGLRSLVARFDWDGVNLAELYFESLEGAANPARFTPFAPHASQLLENALGFSVRDALSDTEKLPRLLAARADLAARLQQRWLGALQEERQAKPYLDLVLTHIDDRFDQSMREKLGADAARLLPVAAAAKATFLVEDPATVWHLGPERYAEIARRYARLGAPPESLAIDLNIVERYQDVYPTKQQTGVELLQLVRVASKHFARVVLYFENSISRADWPLLASATAFATFSHEADMTRVNLPTSAYLRFAGCATVNGRLWPATDGQRLLLPAGSHVVRPCEQMPELRLADFQGTLRQVSNTRDESLEIDYESQTRAIAVLTKGERRKAILLPAGRHRVSVGIRD